MLNSLFCQDAVFAHCSFLLWFYTNDWARLCMVRPWPPQGSGTGSCTLLPPYSSLESCRRARRRPLITHKGCCCSLECCRGAGGGGFVPFWEGVVFEQSRYCSIRSVLRHRCWKILEPYCRPDRYDDKPLINRKVPRRRRRFAPHWRKQAISGLLVIVDRFGVRPSCRGRR